MKREPDLNAAYALSSTEEVQKLYARWAQSYDTGFGEAQGYQLPRLVAQAFVAKGGTGPILDVGAGTGLVAEHLAQLGKTPMDALDLSPDMLKVADGKSLYRNLIVADVTQPLDVPGNYHGVVSAGTFTHGHVGPDAIENLLNAAAPDAVFALTVNLEHFRKTGFGNALAQYGDRITDISYQDLPIYDDRADEPQRNDVARIVTFRKV